MLALMVGTHSIEVPLCQQKYIKTSTLCCCCYSFGVSQLQNTVLQISVLLKTLMQLDDDW